MRTHHLNRIAEVQSPQAGITPKACGFSWLSRCPRIACCVTLLSTSLLKAEGQQQLPGATVNSQPTFQPTEVSRSVWEGALGEGFRSTAQSISVGAGANYGIASFGSREAHDLVLVNVTYGHMLGGVWGRGHWYQGNPEFRLEIFTGAQFSPTSEWLVGLTPHVRYDLATGTRWIPFADIGAGVTATGIGPPDLSGTFEFNLQAGGGVQWFIKDDMAITLDVHYLHWSCAGLHQPNLGLNGVIGIFGVAFFF